MPSPAEIVGAMQDPTEVVHGLGATSVHSVAEVGFDLVNFINENAYTVVPLLVLAAGAIFGIEAWIKQGRRQ